MHTINCSPGKAKAKGKLQDWKTEKLFIPRRDKVSQKLAAASVCLKSIEN